MKPLAVGVPLIELEEFVRSRGVPAYRAKQIADWIYKKRVSSFEAMTDVPQELRPPEVPVRQLVDPADALVRRRVFHPPRRVHRYRSVIGRA